MAARIDKALEEVTKNCKKCQTNHKEDLKTPLHLLEFTSKPWQGIHLDFACPFRGQMWLILIDSYSKCPELVRRRTTTASKTINELRLIFARFGIPEQILTENVPQFVSEEFQEFTRSIGIKHSTLYPRSNRMAERFVQTFKAMMRKMVK